MGVNLNGLLLLGQSHSNLHHFFFGVKNLHMASVLLMIRSKESHDKHAIARRHRDSSRELLVDILVGGS